MSARTTRAAPRVPESYASLYAAVTRGRIDDLPGIVRDFHFADRDTRARGVFRVRRGSSLLARALAMLLRLPAEGDAVPLTIATTRQPGRDVWERSFRNDALRTVQVPHGSLMAEYFGPLELRCRVDVIGDQLVLSPAGAALQIVGRSIALPRCLAPRAAASVASVDGTSMRVAVSVSAPIAGELLSYEGLITEVT